MAIGIVGVYVMVVAVRWASQAGKFKIGGVEITAEDLTMKDPSYFDVTKDGRYEVRAKRAVVAFNQNAPIKLIDVSGDLTQNNGTVTKLKAKHGLLENKKGELELFDGIEIDGTNGMMARMSRAMFYSKEGKVVTTEPVSATMPTGSVQAAAMTMLNKSKLVQFRGNVTVRLLPQQGQSLAAGRDARQPVDIRSEELDVDDAAKTAHFRGKVVAVQGETMLQAPYLMVKYEGKAASGLAPAADATPAKGAGNDGAHVTFLWARNGVEVTAGTDRRIVSDLADFDVTADTALFAGNVVATQEKNVLKGGRLVIERKAGKTRLDTPGNGRIAATFHPNAPVQPRAAKRPPGAEEVQGALLGSFKGDRNAPMNVEAATLEVLDASNKAVFEGDVRAHQGDLVMRTSELTAFYSGQTGMGLGSPANPADDAGAKPKGQEKGEIVRLEARRKVILDSKDTQSATAEWADFNVKANTGAAGRRGDGDKGHRRPAQARRGAGRAPQGGPDDRHLPGRGRPGGDAAAAAATPAGSVIRLLLDPGAHSAGEDGGLPTRADLHPAAPQAGQGPGLGGREEEGAGSQCAVTALPTRRFAISALQQNASAAHQDAPRTPPRKPS